MSQEFVCAACGLPQDKSVIMKKIQNHLLCPVCTSNGTTEPEFEASVYAVALGYFMNEQQGYDAIDALQYAYTFVSELPYWKGKDLPPLTQTGLKRMQTIQAMHTRRTRSEYGEESLDFFISHGGAEIDETFVGHLVTALKKQGYSVWYDETNWVTETGQKSETVDKRIEQARHCVTILDQPYFSSEHCKNELHTIFTTKELKHVFPVWSKEINPSFLKQQEHGEKILDIVSVGWNDWLGDGKKLSDALLQLAQQAEGLQRYNNVPLIRTDAQLLEQLESLIHQKISPLKQQELSSATFGFYAEKNRITTLILINKGLSRLPDDIGRCGDLKNLQLGENRLNSLPKSLGNLRDLQKLELQRNQLSSLPTSIGNLVNLKELNLYDNQLASLPASIGNLTNLHVFNLWHNLLESLPKSFGNLTNLRTFHLGENYFASLPASIGNLVNLKELNLDVNKLTSLPASIGNLKNLIHLNLDGNELISLPETFFQLTGLQTLDLRDNYFVSLPENFKEFFKRLRAKGCTIYGIDHLLE